jgi:hypothetical protein
MSTETQQNEPFFGSNARWFGLVCLFLLLAWFVSPAKSPDHSSTTSIDDFSLPPAVKTCIKGAAELMQHGYLRKSEVGAWVVDCSNREQAHYH